MSAERPSAPPALRQVAVFAPLCALISWYWAQLVVDPPGWRIAAVVALATACGLVLALSARLERDGRLNLRFIRVVTVAVFGIAALLAAGLSPALLAPSGWGALTAGLSHGFDGVPRDQWPYDGFDLWVRQVILLAVPLTSVPAAALSLWPPAPGPGGKEAADFRRGGALILLLCPFVFAATERPLPNPPAWGAGLLVVVAAWILLSRPHTQLSSGLMGMAAVIVAGLISLPIAESLQPARPLIEGSPTETERAPAPETGKKERSSAQRPSSAERSRRQPRSGRRDRKREGSQAQPGARRNRKNSTERRTRTAGPRPQTRSPKQREGLPAGAIVVFKAAAVVVILLLVTGRNRRTGSSVDEAAELRSALERLGWSLPPQTTLAELETRLDEQAGPAAARYARRLRERRFAIATASFPAELDRRGLRRALTHGKGLLVRARGFLALPPVPLRRRS